MPDAPEQQARAKIDALLSAAGWVIQDMADFNRNAAEGVAVREFHLEEWPLHIPFDLATHSTP